MEGEARKAFKYAVSAEPQNTAGAYEIGEILLEKGMDQSCGIVLLGLANQPRGCACL